MKKFATLFGAALMAGSALCATAALAADDLTITSWGGAYQESQRNAFFKPFVDAGNKVTEAEYNGEIAKVRAMVEAKAVTWDVVDVDTQTALAGCAEGSFETIDWSKLAWLAASSAATTARWRSAVVSMAYARHTSRVARSRVAAISALAAPSPRSAICSLVSRISPSSSGTEMPTMAPYHG